MKIKLVFYDWIEEKTGVSAYCTPKGVELMIGDFHSGTVFDAEIEPEDYQGEFEKAAKEGLVPVFYVLTKEEK